MTIKPIQPIQPIQSIRPIKAVQPITAFQRKTTQSNSYTDPYAINSFTDVLFNKQGQVRKYGEYNPIKAGVDFIQQSYLKPILKLDIGTTVTNAINAFSEDMDVAANLTKGMIIEPNNETISAIVGGLAALTAGIAVSVATGGIATPLMAGLVVGGVSAVGASVAADPEGAMRGFEKAAGYTSAGKTQYNFEADTGNGLLDFALNMAGEVAVDPLNWFSFGYAGTTKHLSKVSLEAGENSAKVAAKLTNSSNSALKVLQKLSDIDDVVLKASLLSNPLGLSLYGIKVAASPLLSASTKGALKAASDVMTNPKATVGEVNSVIHRVVKASSSAQSAIRRDVPYAFSFLGRTSDESVISWFSSAKKLLLNANKNMSDEAALRNVADIFERHIFGDVDGMYVGINSKTMDTIKAQLDSVVPQGSASGIRLQNNILNLGAIKDYIKQATEHVNNVSYAEEVLQAKLKSFDETIKDASFYDVPYNTRVARVYDALLKEHPEIKDIDTNNIYLQRISRKYNVDINDLKKYSTGQRDFMVTTDIVSRASKEFSFDDPNAVVEASYFKPDDVVDDGSDSLEQLSQDTVIKKIFSEEGVRAVGQVEGFEDIRSIGGRMLKNIKGAFSSQRANNWLRNMESPLLKPFIDEVDSLGSKGLTEIKTIILNDMVSAGTPSDIVDQYAETIRGIYTMKRLIEDPNLLDKMEFAEKRIIMKFYNTVGHTDLDALRPYLIKDNMFNQMYLDNFKIAQTSIGWNEGVVMQIYREGGYLLQLNNRLATEIIRNDLLRSPIMDLFKEILDSNTEAGALFRILADSDFSEVDALFEYSQNAKIILSQLKNLEAYSKLTAFTREHLDREVIEVVDEAYTKVANMQNAHVVTAFTDENGDYTLKPVTDLINDAQGYSDTTRVLDLQDSYRIVTEEEVQRQINLFKKSYDDFIANAQDSRVTLQEHTAFVDSMIDYYTRLGDIKDFKKAIREHEDALLEQTFEVSKESTSGLKLFSSKDTNITPSTIDWVEVPGQSKKVKAEIAEIAPSFYKDVEYERSLVVPVRDHISNLKKLYAEVDANVDHKPITDMTKYLDDISRVEKALSEAQDKYTEVRNSFLARSYTTLNMDTKIPSAIRKDMYADPDVKSAHSVVKQLEALLEKGRTRLVVDERIKQLPSLFEKEMEGLNPLLDDMYRIAGSTRNKPKQGVLNRYYLSYAEATYKKFNTYLEPRIAEYKKFKDLETTGLRKKAITHYEMPFDNKKSNMVSSVYGDKFQFPSLNAFYVFRKYELESLSGVPKESVHKLLSDFLALIPEGADAGKLDVINGAFNKAVSSYPFLLNKKGIGAIDVNTIPHISISGTKIKKFSVRRKGVWQHSVFSNFSSLPKGYSIHVEGDSFNYPTVEHAYQASKTKIEAERVKIRNAKTPGEAKRIGRNEVTLIDDWDKKKLGIMKRLVKQKFSIPEYKQALLSTKYMTLEEGNTWGDCFFGIYENSGENHLGKMLMDIRKEFVKEGSPSSYLKKEATYFGLQRESNELMFRHLNRQYDLADKLMTVDADEAQELFKGVLNDNASKGAYYDIVRPYQDMITVFTSGDPLQYTPNYLSALGSDDAYSALSKRSVDLMNKKGNNRLSLVWDPAEVSRISKYYNIPVSEIYQFYRITFERYKDSVDLVLRNYSFPRFSDASTTEIDIFNKQVMDMSFGVSKKGHAFYELPDDTGGNVVTLKELSSILKNDFISLKNKESTLLVGRYTKKARNLSIYDLGVNEPGVSYKRMKDFMLQKSRINTDATMRKFMNEALLSKQQGLSALEILQNKASMFDWTEELRADSNFSF